MSCSCSTNPGLAFPIFVGDLLPIYEADASSCAGAFDFTGWTLSFEMVGPVTVTGTATGNASGVLTHVWVAGDTSVPGDYQVIFHGISPAGARRTFVALGVVSILPV